MRVLYWCRRHLLPARPPTASSRWLELDRLSGRAMQYRLGLGDEIALSKIDFDGLHLRQCFRAIDLFCHRLHAEYVADAVDRVHDLVVDGIAPHVPDEHAGDLEDIHR